MEFECHGNRDIHIRLQSLKGNMHEVTLLELHIIHHRLHQLTFTLLMSPSLMKVTIHFSK